MSNKALQEPAILHLIFLSLDQEDLIQTQKVCQTWRRTILTSRTFLQVLSLRPRPAHFIGTQDPSTIDPLLSSIFASFLSWGPASWDGYRGNAGPWVWPAERNWTSDLSQYKKFTHPEASWRRMLPWNDPPPTQLQVHAEGKEGGTISRMEFDNESNWLTMGLLWDVVENCWFRGDPWWVKRVEIEAPGRERWRYGGSSTLPVGAKVPEEVRKSVARRPGRVNLNMTIDERSVGERREAREKAVKERLDSVRRIERQWFRPCGTRPRRMTACDRHVFTDEWRAEGGKAFGDVEWDEVWGYEIEREEEEEMVVNVPRVSRRKKFLGVLLRR
ncbi:hypothetical protein M409DRAFT_28422 [Zasmidium cellare ATCC 36951]|uniref:F-box domain-containing protein n=1 Tax=Zasmidium cellare ATCC 36951 TaxID=1080233 RepID=A0A6A6C229_ZASCE|nr:uncharacterized protein M409DRAFT_28422 [Zasmidium cellare ATCC 36951]KAF2161091.1 hypothetical protein M409DRAFT_28422 [Zasmidium cellare ATCC 36951]